MRETKAGELEPGVLTALATAARAIVALSAASELEERIAALERAAGVTGQDRPVRVAS